MDGLRHQRVVIVDHYPTPQPSANSLHLPSIKKDSNKTVIVSDMQQRKINVAKLKKIKVK